MLFKNLYRLPFPAFASQYKSILRNFSYKTAMGDQLTDLPGLTVDEAIQKLEYFAPLSLAGSWDNVGLLVQPLTDKKIRNVMLTNDLTEDVVEEAVSKNTNLVVTYHPNIFTGMKNVTLRSWKERIVVQCIKNNIAVFSPHTSWDVVDGGVNDWLVAAFTVSSVKPIQPQKDNPKIGEGRLAILKSPISIQEAVQKVKKHTKLDFVRLGIAKGCNLDSTISSIAICAGSGNSVLKGVKADLYFTGEMLHHDVLEATQNGINVILTNHSDSERGFLYYFQGHLEKNIFEGKNNADDTQAEKEKEPPRVTSESVNKNERCDLCASPIDND